MDLYEYMLVELRYTNDLQPVPHTFVRHWLILVKPMMHFCFFRNRPITAGNAEWVDLTNNRRMYLVDISYVTYDMRVPAPEPRNSITYTHDISMACMHNMSMCQKCP